MAKRKDKKPIMLYLRIEEHTALDKIGLHIQKDYPGITISKSGIMRYLIQSKLIEIEGEEDEREGQEKS